MYKGEELCTQRLDMIVDDTVVVETKVTLDLHPAARRQLYNYLRATSLEVGLRLYFGRKPEFYRVICRNGRQSGSAPRRDLEHIDLSPPKRADRDIALDPTM